jgi:hypothetical protein
MNDYTVEVAFGELTLEEKWARTIEAVVALAYEGSTDEVDTFNTPSNIILGRD